MDELRIKTVFDKLQDDESRMIFMHRLQHYLDGDHSHLFDMLEDMECLYDMDAGDPTHRLKNRLLKLKNIYKANPKPIVFYGATRSAPILIKYVTKNGMKIDCFCDSNPELAGTMKFGYPIISREDLLRDYREAYIVVGAASGPYFSSIHQSIINLGFNAGQIFGLFPWMAGEPQYFGLDAIKPVADEVFIDAGALDGQTIQQFVAFCDGNYKKIYSMEPDPYNYKKTCDFIQEKGYRDVEVVAKGVWSREDLLSFKNTSNIASRLDDSGGIKVPVTSIDSMVNADTVTFIKMDVEGAELEALKGAQNTIRKYLPKLAVCLYHKREDILSLPCYINAIAPEYKFYIRHHSSYFMETVLYAIP